MPRRTRTTASSVETRLDSGNRAEFVQSLGRGLEVIRAFDSDHPSMSLSQMADRTGMTRATARRFLLTLQALGYVRADGRQFRLTHRVLDLGYAYLSALALSDLILPLMEQLVKEVDESSSLSVLDGNEIVYVLRVPVRKVMTVRLAVGARLPAYATSMGRVLLAALSEEEQRRRLGRRALEALTPHTLHSIPDLLGELRRVKAQGYALVEQELELGLCSLAVPIHHQGHVAAALNVGMRWHPTRRQEALRFILPALQKTAAGIERVARHLPTFL